MMRATDQQQWVRAVELDGVPRVPIHCQQSVPYHPLCADQVDYVCDRCRKGICSMHCRLATMPRRVDRDPDVASTAHELGRWARAASGDPVPSSIRGLDAPRADLCTTCQRLEEFYGIAIEEISDAQRCVFLDRDDVAPYVSRHERGESGGA